MKLFHVMKRDTCLLYSYRLRTVLIIENIVHGNHYSIIASLYVCEAMHMNK